MVIFMSCQYKDTSSDNFQPQLVAILTDSLESAMNWYTENLGFEIEKGIMDYPENNLRAAIIKKEGFHLELIEQSPSYQQSIVLPDAEHQLGGIAKLGFIVENIEEVYNGLQTRSTVDFVTEIGSLPDTELSIKWPKRYFLIKDVDGNYLQFFSYDDLSISQSNPWLVMVTVQNIEESASWYAEKLGFVHLTTVGNPGNQRAILVRNNYVLELFEPSKITLRKNISADSSVLGFSKVAFGVLDMNSLHNQLKKRNVEIASEPDSSEFDWATKSMIVCDNDGNWIQIFELTK
jgi:catechol 2,3-dioxygenase-like lactoylglutathione lyase family enzyme